MKWFLLSVVLSVFLAMSCQDVVNGGRVVHRRIVYENVKLEYVLDSVLETGTKFGKFDIYEEMMKDSSVVMYMYAPLYRDSVESGMIRLQRVDSIMELYDVIIDNKYPTSK